MKRKMKENIDDTILTLIVKHLGNELDDSEKEQFNRWLTASENHQKELDNAQKIWDMASPESPVDFNTEFAWKNLNQRMLRMDSQTIQQHKPFISWALQIAASIVILIGFGVTYYWLHHNSNYKEINAFTNKIIEPVVLPDGTKVFLNTGAKIKYPVTFQKYRKVELTGEAFFNVTHNENSPFVIQTSNAQIKVLGTSFNVCESQDSVQVVVESGVVELTSRKTNKNIRLMKGNSGICFASTNKLVKTISADINSYAWKTNVITFNNVDLNYVSKTLSKLFHKPIRFENEQLKLLKLNATYKDLDLESIFKALKATHCLQINKREDGYYISGSGC